MLEEEPLPHIGVHAPEVAQRIERELVVRARRVGGVDDMEEEVHGRAFRKCAESTTQLRTSCKR
jgi:hypothetical protein